ncbi:ATP-binding protein [Paenibacillus naphthalenovorans]|uniref:ATP-binding protein n=1 Tax=Paenibacillus naphthalenovorans TaxID=162209 RepID=UPI003D28F5F8
MKALSCSLLHNPMCAPQPFYYFHFIRFESLHILFYRLIMTAAMIDRLTHQPYHVNMIGNSYRMKETKEWLQKQQLA